jgi:hypothetical protein
MRLKLKKRPFPNGTSYEVRHGHMILGFVSRWHVNDHAGKTWVATAPNGLMLEWPLKLRRDAIAALLKPHRTMLGPVVRAT